MSAVELFRFRVAGSPVPQGSKRVWVNRKTGRAQMAEDQGSRHSSWRYDVTVAAEEAKARAGLNGPTMAPVSLVLTFFVTRGATHYGSGRNEQTVKPSAPAYPVARPDIDKLARSILDALTAAKVFVDDSQVCAMTCRKKFVDRFDDLGAGVEVIVGEIE